MKTALKERREKQGLTQVQVAERANITERSYLRYETGERLPDVHVGQRIAKALNTKVEKIFPLSFNDTPNSQQNNTTKQEK